MYRHPKIQKLLCNQQTPHDSHARRATYLANTQQVSPPPHPLKDAVAVGEFELDEKINKTTVETGESFLYEFNIFGEGNVAGITDPIVPSDKNLDIYPPNISQDVNRGGGRVTGSKNYSFFGIPNEPGKYD